ncbi:MAG: hypothetical protein NC131_11455 [Roseburia sp.]|nr:hypothetical protein [Roseburia sp.]
MKVIGIKIIDDTEVPIVVECTSFEVDGHSGYDEKFDPNNCRICMRSTHPSLSYFIIKTERYSKEGSSVRPYRWLTKADVEPLMKCASESDVIDLRKFGNYQICSEGKIQSVFIMNDIDDWDGEDRPLLVKLVEEKED